MIVLVAFMYMYYVQRYDEGVECDYERNVCICDATDKDNFCSYKDSFYNVFGYLAGGPDGTTDFLDVLCGMSCLAMNGPNLVNLVN